MILDDIKYASREAVLKAVSFFTGGLFDFHLSDFDNVPALKQLPKDIVKASEAVISMSPVLEGLAKSPEASSVDIQHALKSVSNSTVQRALEETGFEKQAEEREEALKFLDPDTVWWRVENPKDAKTCDRCWKWTGIIVSNKDPTLPDVTDFEEEALHINCRCQLVLIDPKEVWGKLHGREFTEWLKANSRT